MGHRFLNTKDSIPIKIRYLELDDLESFFQQNLPEKKHHNFNAPYFKKRTTSELKEYVESIRQNLQCGEIDVLDHKKLLHIKVLMKSLAQLTGIGNQKKQIGWKLGLLFLMKNIGVKA